MSPLFASRQNSHNVKQNQGGIHSIVVQPIGNKQFINARMAQLPNSHNVKQNQAAIHSILAQPGGNKQYINARMAQVL